MSQKKLIPSTKYLEWRKLKQPKTLSTGQWFVKHFALIGIIMDPSEFSLIAQSKDNRAPYLILPLVDWSN